MIDEKIVIRDIENRIDTFVKQYPKEKDCRSVQVQREFIHILELAAKKQKAKEHERMLSIESELLGTLNDMKDSKVAFCDKQGGKCGLYENCFKGKIMVDRYLFKAKFDDSDRWVKGELVEVNDNYLIVPNHASKILAFWFLTSNIIEVRKDTICQCTGLKDKNGNFIWENDIVNFLGHKGIIKYECGSFGIVYKNIIDWDEIESEIMPVTGCENALYACENDNYISLWEIYWNFNDEDDCLSTVEIIGNTFDNPELLESEE